MSQDPFRAVGAYRIEGKFDDLDKEVLASSTADLKILGSLPYDLNGSEQKENEIPNDMQGAPDGFFTRLYKEHKTAGKLLTMFTGAMFVLPGCITPDITPNKPPVAELSYPDNVLKNKEITFNSSQSYDPDGKILAYVWDFGDGRKDGTLDPWIKHAYRQAGNYTGKLTVVDNKNATSSKNFAIEVFKPTPALDYAKEKALPAAYQEKITGYFDKDETLTSYEKDTVDLLAETKIPIEYFLFSEKQGGGEIVFNTLAAGIVRTDYLNDKEKKNALDDLLGDLNTNRSATIELIGKNSGLDLKYRLKDKQLDIDGDSILDKNEKGIDKFRLNYVVDFPETNNSFAVMNIPVGWSKTYDDYTGNVSEEKYPDGFVRVDNKFDRLLYSNIIENDRIDITTLNYSQTNGFVKGYPRMNLIVEIRSFGKTDENRKIIHDIFNPNNPQLTFQDLKDKTENNMKFSILATEGYIKKYNNTVRIVKPIRSYEERAGQKPFEKDVNANFKKLNNTGLYLGEIDVPISFRDKEEMYPKGSYKDVIEGRPGRPIATFLYGLDIRVISPEQKYGDYALVHKFDNPEDTEKVLRRTEWGNIISILR